MSNTNRRMLIASLPTGKLAPENFSVSESPIPSPADGEVLVRVRYALIDAAMRAWMLGPTYRAALKPGDVMAGAALCEVADSRASGFAPGDLVYTDDANWQNYAVLKPSQLLKLGRANPITHLVSVYGTAGLTAYFGLMEIGKPQPGETVLVSAAAGAVGTFAGQIAKLKGCRVIGLAGGKEKCDFLTHELRFDAAIDYKAGNLYQAIMAATGGVDIFFDNVGGEVFEATLFAMKPFGRLIACGAVSAYDGAAMQAVRGVPAWFISRRLSLRGFIVSDFYARREQAIDELRGWVESGKIKVHEDIVDGFEQLPAALIGLLAGDNIGKRMVRIS